MRNRLVLLALLAFAAPDSTAGTVVDRIVAKVNRQVILESDWQEELGFECLMSGRAPSRLTPEERKAALDRLIDQELLREQMRAPEFKPAAAGEIESKIAALKNDLLGRRTTSSWERVLAGYGLTEKMVRNHVALELDQLRFIDLRLRPAIQVGPGEIESYYKEQLLKKLPASAKAPSLAQASPQIRELLVQERINQMLGSWLKSLRSQAHLQTSFGEPSGAERGGK